MPTHPQTTRSRARRSAARALCSLPGADSDDTLLPDALDASAGCPPHGSGLLLELAAPEDDALARKFGVSAHALADAHGARRAVGATRARQARSASRR